MICYNMANAILNSNSSSALISAVDAVSSAKNPFEYSYASKGMLTYSHVPAHARVVSTSQATSIGFGQNNDYSILKSGLIENAFLKIVVKNESGANAFLNASIGNLICQDIQLITQGKVICHSTPFGRACLMSDAPYARKKNMEKMLGLQAVRHTLADDASLTFYVPLGFSCFDSPSSFLDTNFVEPLTVRVRTASANAYADDGGAGDGTAVARALTLSSMELVQVFRMLPNQLEQQTISANYQDDDLVRVEWDMVEERTTKTLAAAVSQKIEHTITTNRCVAKMFIAVEDTVDGTATDLNSQAEGRYLELSNIKISANGQDVMDVPADLIGYCLGSDAGVSNSPNCVSNYFDDSYSHSKNIYCVDFGLLKATDHFSGMISARELNAFRVEVTTSSGSAVTATAHNLLVMMIAPQLTSTSSASGKISTSLSS